jgi:RNA polymerase sigma-70 factor, ECF subfamily
LCHTKGGQFASWQQPEELALRDSSKYNETIADTIIETSEYLHASDVSQLEHDRMRDAIQRLPVEFREIILLRELEELSYREISETLNCPPVTVMSCLARARTKLRALLSSVADPSLM